MIGLLARLLAAVGIQAVNAEPVVAVPLPPRGLVVVLRPEDVDEITRIALARVTGELAAARFQVTVMPLDPGRDPSPQVEAVARGSSPVAVFAIAHIADHDGDTIAIWVCDRVGRRTTIQRMAIRGDNIRQDAEVLALEAIELIRVSISGLWPSPQMATKASGATPAASAPAAPASPAPAMGTEAAPETAIAVVRAPAGASAVTPGPGLPSAAGRGRPELSLELGVSALRDFPGQSTQWMGALMAMVRWPRGLAARASVAGLGSPVVLSGAGGTAELRRVLAALGGAWFLSGGGPAELYVSAALGVAHTGVTGTSTDPARAGQQDSGWVSTGDAGIGAQVRLAQRIYLGAAADLVWSWSQLNVLIGDTRTTALLRPGALFTLGLQTSF